MIGSIWLGWTTHQKADSYEKLLKTDIFPGIAAKNVQGYQGVQLFRRFVGEEAEFIVIMRFESLETVKQLAGEDYEHAYVPSEAPRILPRFDDRSQHHETREETNY